MRISVITPTLNLIDGGRRDLFLDAVRSVRAQTHADIEHLVVDGASADGTPALLQELQGKGEIAGFRSETDGGIYEAMNRGAGMATGDLLMFLNSDDFYHRADGLAEIAEAAKGGCDFVCSPVLYLSDPPRLFRVGRNFSRILLRIPFGHPGMAVRREVFDAYGGFDTRFRISADYDLMLRLVMGGASSVVLDDAFVSYRLDGLSGDEARRLDDRVRLLKKNLDGVMEMSEAEWRAALTEERLPPRFLRAMLAAPDLRWNMKLIALYQLVRSLRRSRHRTAA